MKPLGGFLLFSVVALLGTAQANAKPNFSGEWKLNAAKSEFGPMPAPDKRTDKITHPDPSLKISTTASGAQGEMSFDLSYTTDGKESTNQLRGSPAKSTAKWDADTLGITTKAKFHDIDM